MKLRPPVWHVYYLTRGTAGAYIDALQRAFNECQIRSRCFVSCRYSYDTVGVTKCFFPLTDQTRLRPRLVKALRGAELILAYTWIATMAAIKRPRVNVHLVDDFYVTYAFFKVIGWLGLPIDITCHDVVPQFTGMSRRRLAMYRRSQRLIVHNASASQLLIRCLDTNTISKVVTYPFPSSSYESICSKSLLGKAKKDLARCIGRERDYVLFLGVVQEKKGIETLLKAWGGIGTHGSHKLVIAGKWVNSTSRVRTMAEQASHCTLIDRYVSDEEFVSLIDNALCVVLPYTEYAHSAILYSCANQHVATIVSDIPLFRELLPDYDLMFGVGDWVALSDVLKRVLSMSPDEVREYGHRLCSQLGRSGGDLSAGVWDAYASPLDESELSKVSMSAGARREQYYLKLPRPLQTMAVNVIGLRHRRTRMGLEFQQELALLERSDRYSQSDLVALQEERLRALIDTAYNHAPYYRHLFRQEGLTPQDVRSPNDLAKLPVLEKYSVARFCQTMMNVSVSNHSCVPGHTSGSTGTSLRLMYDRRALAAEFATVWRLRRRVGCDVDDWHATFAGRLCVPKAQSKPPFHRVNYTQRQILFSLYHLNKSTAPAYVAALGGRDLQYYSGYPSALESLTIAAEEAGCTVPPPAKALFTSSESLSMRQKARLEKHLRVPVWDRYGCAEFCVSFTVCEDGRYHLDSEFCIVECEPLEESEEWIRGELLCTGLMNHAMPFIRYRVGDVATIAKTPCPCGRASMSAFAIDGRREDFVMTRDGVRLGRLDHLFKDMHRIHESQITQEQPGRMRIRIVRSPEYTSVDEKQLLAECNKRMGQGMEIELEYISEIPRNAAGKFRAVINSMAKEQRYDN